MTEAIIFAVVMIFGVPVGLMLTGAVWSALFGGLAEEAAGRGDAEQPG
jgi:hypothetical protein